MSFYPKDRKCDHCGKAHNDKWELNQYKDKRICNKCIAKVVKD